MKEATFYASYSFTDAGTGMNAVLLGISASFSSVSLVYAAVDMRGVLTEAVVPNVTMRIQVNNPQNLIFPGSFVMGSGSGSRSQNIYANPTRPWRGVLKFAPDDLGNELEIRFFYGGPTLGNVADVTLGFLTEGAVSGNTLQVLDPQIVLLDTLGNKV